MAYIGVSPSNGVRRVHTYTATGSQTTFSGAGAEGTSLSYKDSNFVDVYQNGVKLGDADYTATSGTSIVLGTGATASDLVVIVVFDVFSVADTVSKADGGTFDGNVTMAGTLDVTGNGTVGGTLGVTGVLTANAGIKVDNITIDGTEIDLSSGDVTIDAALDIKLDAAGGDIKFLSDGTEFGEIRNISSDLTIISSVNNADIVFKGQDGGSEIEVARFDMSEDGAFVVGATSQVGGGAVGVSFNDNAVNGIDMIVEQDASSAGYIVFRNSSSTVIGQVKRNGTANEMQYVTTSDYRLKENINYDFDASSVLKKLKPCEFNWIDDKNNTTITGFIAHEVQEIVPHAASGEKDEMETIKDADGKEQTIIKPQGIDKGDLVPLLTKSLQEALTRIETLEAEVKALKG